jgi:arsenite oxidase small subunit
MSSEGEVVGQRKARRSFLKVVMAAGLFTMTAALASVLRLLAFVPQSAEGTAEQLSWPRVKIANIRSLNALRPIRFNYPLIDTPNILVRLGTTADNGVGPDRDTVAYSIICQHLGCFYAFVPAGSSPPCNSYTSPIAEGYCCCHGGEYDLVHGAKVIGGPPPREVPAVRLEYDESSGDIYAVGMGPPTIFGHGPPGTTEPLLVLKHDLEGGEIVTEDTVLSGGQ